MMPTLAPPSVLSAPQRRCQILLTLFQPGLTATMATFSELNGVDPVFRNRAPVIPLISARQKRYLMLLRVMKFSVANAVRKPQAAWT